MLIGVSIVIILALCGIIGYQNHYTDFAYQSMAMYGQYYYIDMVSYSTLLKKKGTERI